MDWKYDDGRVYSTDDKGELTAEATYKRINGDVVDIDHTYVIPALRGNGMAAEMMAALGMHLRKNGLKAVASCSYANAWLRRNKDAYQDIIYSDTDDNGPACSIDGRH